jgi:type II secretion system protein H
MSGSPPWPGPAMNMRVFHHRGCSRSPARSIAPPCRAAFTLIEVLLVIVVIGIAVGIAMPSFVNSMQGRRLQSAARMLTSVTRYARSMAVLKQTDLALVLNLANGQVDVVSSNAAASGLSRTLDGVVLQQVAVEGAEPVTEGACAVPFRRNGVCVPFTVILADTRNSTMTVKVDALGSVKVTARSTW